MESMNYWQLFLQTGAPEFYLLYNNAKKMESGYVLDGSGPCTAGDPLQGL